jgi:hypothetical protein
LISVIFAGGRDTTLFSCRVFDLSLAQVYLGSWQCVRNKKSDMHGFEKWLPTSFLLGFTTVYVRRGVLVIVMEDFQDFDQMRDLEIPNYLTSPICESQPRFPNDRGVVRLDRRPAAATVPGGLPAAPTGLPN